MSWVDFDLPAETAIQMVDRDGNLLVEEARGSAQIVPVARWLSASLDADEIANQLTIDGALVAVTGAQATGIRVAVQTPRDRLRSDARRELFVELGLILLVLAVTCVAARSYARHAIADRLAELKRLGDRLRRGDLSARLAQIRGNDEIAELGHVLNHMAMEVEHRVSELRAREAASHHEATHDVLTGLPNRRAFLAELARRVAPGPCPVRGFALLLVDLDNFKRVNDGLGHDAGDRVLCVVSQRLRSLVRESDLVARLAGDEFALLLPDGAGDATDLLGLVGRIEEGLRLPLDYAGCVLRTTASIGVAVFPNDQSTAADLLRAADIALYAAKFQGRGRAIRFEPTMEVAPGGPIANGARRQA